MLRVSRLEFHKILKIYDLSQKNVKNVDKSVLCRNINSTLSQKRQKFTNFDLKIPIFQGNKNERFQMYMSCFKYLHSIFLSKIG